MSKKDFTIKSMKGGFRLSRVLLTICFVMFSGLLFASHAQDVKLSLTLNNETMSSAIQKIAKQSNVDFFYSQQQISRVDKKVSGNFESSPLSVILTQVLSNTDFTFKFEENGVVIIPRPVSVAAVQQQAKRELKGKIIDSLTQQPLAGATVIVSGTTLGAIADQDGKFVIANILPSHKTIEASFMGYTPKVLNIEGKSDIIIQMSIAATRIEDVVVTGVFTRKQNTYSGSVSTIKAEELQRTGNLNIIQALGNIDPSFSILQNNDMGSNPNATPDIQMRGAGSFSDMKGKYTSSPNQPLFIVDGFEQSVQKVLDMDMNRVESVTLLKDATAKAIYGSKGANGVVVIETKAPKKGALQVSYKGDLNIQSPSLRSYDRANAAEKLEVERRAGVYTSTDPFAQTTLNSRYNEIYKEVLRGVDTDWLAQPTRVGIGHKHSLNIEGGDDAIRYNVNVGYNDVAGVMKGSARKTFEGGFNLQYRYKTLLFKEQFTFLSNNSAESPYGSFESYAKMNPYWRVKDANGNLSSKLGNYNALQAEGNMSIYNPMMNAYSNYKNTEEYYDFTNNFYVEWSPAQDLKLVGRLGVTKRKGQTDLFYPTNYTTLDPLSKMNYINVKPDDADDAYFKRGLYNQTLNDKFTLSSDITLNYSKQIEKHLIFLNAQYNISTSDIKNNLFEGEGFADNATEITQARSYKESSSPSGYDDKVREIGAIASINYSYDSRYLFDANYRANASSLFGTNNRWGHFWSVGAGWNVHNEKFMKNADWLNLLKVRASFGYTGSQNFSAYQAIATYSFFNNDIYDNVIGSYLLAMHNPDLKWQLTQDQNIGFDMTLFKKLDVTLDYYIKNTSNLLTPITAAPSIGFETFVENLGKSRNSGIEAKVNYRIINDSKKDIYLSAFGSLAHNKNKLVEINAALSTLNSESDKSFNTGGTNEHYKDKVATKPRVEYAEGVSLSAIWAVPSLGIDPLNGQEIFIKKDGTYTYKWSVDDKRPLGDALPKVQGNFGFNIDYKGFSVNAIFNYRIGGQYYNQTVADNVENADVNYNVDRRVFTDRWNPLTPGVVAKYNALSKYPIFTKPTSRFIQDYNELTLSSLNLGYDFRNCAFMQKSQAVERLRLSFAMNDLFRVSTVKTERGILYPYAQSFIFTVQATF